MEKSLEILSQEIPQGETFETFPRSHLRNLAEEVGKGETLWPLRYSLSGKEKSPDPFTLIDILGIEECKQRIKNAIEI